MTLMLTIFSILIPMHYQVPYQKNPGPLLDARIHKDIQRHINKYQPEVVLLGDSVLDSIVNEKRLGILTEKRVYKLAIHGSASAIWYLSIKNNIITARHKPDYVVVFFRGTMLTTPEFRTTGTYQVLIDELSGPDDQLLIDLAYVRQMNWVDRTLDQYFPFYAYRQLVRNSLEDKIKYPLLKFLFHYEKTDVDNAVDVVFGDPNIALLGAIINNSESNLYQSDKLDFDDQLPQSFLPETIRLCRENDIQLVFVRTKTEQYYPRGIQSAEMNRYLDSLINYLDRRGVMFIDFGSDPRLTPEYFSDPIHMTEEGQRVFTEVLAEKMNNVIP